MECRGKVGHILVLIHHNAIMSIIFTCYTACRLGTETLIPNIPGFQVLKRCIQYLDIHPNKPIFYPSNYYYGSNVIRLTWSVTQVEYYATQNFI